VNTVKSDWQNANEGRSYPLDDAATLADDTGLFLPNNFLSDLHVYLPYSLGRQVFLSAAAVSAKLVTLIVSVYSGGNNIPLASASLVRPVVRGRVYPLEPLYDGAAGWASFGGAAVDDAVFSLRFSTPAQTLAARRIVYNYDDVPVTSLGKDVSSVSLTGLVRLRGKAGVVTVVGAQRLINGELRTVALISLDTALQGATILTDFAGKCGHRPEARNCNKRVIESINGIEPDCDGNINVEFAGGVVVGSIPHGLILDHPVGLAEACAYQRISSLSGPSDVCEEP